MQAVTSDREIPIREQNSRVNCCRVYASFVKLLFLFVFSVWRVFSQKK